MTKTRGFILALFLLVIAGSAFAQGAPVIAKLVAYDGTVDVLRGGIPMALYPELPIFSGDVVDAKDGWTRIRFTDGTELRLKAHTRISLNDDGQRRSVEVLSGRLWASVPATGTETSFKSAATTVAAVGATLGYSADPSGRVRVGTAEGTVTVTTTSAAGAGAPVPLDAGQQTTIEPGGTVGVASSYAPGDIVEVAVPAAAALAITEPTLDLDGVDETLTPTEPIDDGSGSVAGTAAVGLVGLSVLDGVTDSGDTLSADGFAQAQPMYIDDSVAPEDESKQGQYAIQLINALGLNSALPPSATMRDAADFLTRLDIIPCGSNTCGGDRAPLLPFSTTAGLFVLDSGSGHVLQIDQKGNVSIVVTTDELTAATGKTQASLSERGIAVDHQGSMFFTVQSTPGLLRRDVGGGITLLQPESGPTLVEPANLAFGADNYIYVPDAGLQPQRMVQVDGETGTLASLVTDEVLKSLGLKSINVAATVVDERNTVYVVSTGEPNAVLAIDADGTPRMLSSGQFNKLAPYITRGPDRSIVVVDKAADTIYKITPEGVTTVLISKEQIAKAIPSDVEFSGGFAYDDDEHLYLLDSTSDSILRFDKNGNGKVWVTAEDIQEVTQVRPNLDSGVAFECRSVVSAGWAIDQPITLQDLLCIAGIDPNDPSAPLTISLDELIENILERYSELFWLQTRRKQSVSPFAP